MRFLLESKHNNLYKAYTQGKIDYKGNGSHNFIGFINELFDTIKQDTYIIQQEYKKEVNEYLFAADIQLEQLKQDLKNSEEDYLTAKGNADGIEQAVRDYFSEYTSLLNPDEFTDLLKGIATIPSIISNADEEFEKLSDSMKELHEIFKNREEIFADLGTEKKSYYSSYLEITLALELIPVKINKANKLKKDSGGDSKTLKEIKALKLFEKKSKYGQPSSSNIKFVLLKNGQGWKDKDGDIWKKDQLHKDHWDISDGTSNNSKIMEIDYNGKLLWPAGPKNTNK